LRMYFNVLVNYVAESDKSYFILGGKNA